MALFGGITLPGAPDLENIRRLDLLPMNMTRRMSRLGFAIDKEYFEDLSSQFAAGMAESRREIIEYIPSDRLDEFVGKSVEAEAEPDAADEGALDTLKEAVDASMNVGSAEQIGKLLYEVLGVGLGKKLKLTKAGDRISTGKKQLELLRHDHPVIPKILEYRELAKLKSTYTDALPAIARLHPRGEDCPVCGMWHERESWRVHGEIVSTRTSTGRFAHRRPNLGNIPGRTDNGGAVRAGFVASPGLNGLKKPPSVAGMQRSGYSVLVSTDFSQIELRDLAHCANAASMIKVYEEDRDIHVFTACAAFGLSEQKFTELLSKKKKELTQREIQILEEFKLRNRLPAKNLNFMIVYGATVIGLLSQLALSGLLWSEEEGNEFIRRWFGLYPEVEEYIAFQHYLARRYRLVFDPFGRWRDIPEVKSVHSWIRDAGLRQAGNMKIQSFAAGQMKLGMGQVDAEILELQRQFEIWVWPLMTIHDQVITEVESEWVEPVKEIQERSFDNVMVDKDTGENLCRVPIKSDTDIGTRWVKG